MKDFRICHRALMKELRPLAGKVAVSGTLGLVEVAASMAFVWMSKRVTDIATGALDAELWPSVRILLAIMFLQVICRVAARYWEGWFTVNTQNARRAGAFERVMRSVWGGQEKFHSGDAVNRLEEDVRVTTDFICVSTPDIVITVVQLVAASAFLFFLSPDLAWILVFIMPVAIVGSRLFFRKLRELTGRIRAVEGSIQGHMQENLQHRVLIKTLGSTAKVLERMTALQGEVRDITRTRLNYNAVSRGFMQLGFASGYALVFLWGVFGLQKGTVTYGMMVAFLQLVGQVQRPVAALAMQIPAYIKALSSEERILELDELPQEEEGTPVALEGAPGVLVDGISFAYEDKDGNVLDSFSFDFKPGTMTVILGQTGAGKSTLIRLIMALLTPSKGSISLYSNGFSHISDTDTRCNFMYVPQGNSLMSGTIRENLALASAQATEEQMKDALHLAAADFVNELPDGLDTRCSEVGSGLSEGQAQRIAIARALLRPGGILVLDEATSALDEETEKLLLQRLADRYHGSRTILCITHRQAAANYADAVITING